MSKRILSIAALSAIFITRAWAESGSAQQTIQLNLRPVIEIAAITGNTINMSFSSASNYATGRTSDNQVFKVRSNKGFVVSVSSDAPTFSYTGNQAPAQAMPVDKTLFFSLVDNNTKGSVASGITTETSLGTTAKDILINCEQGDERTFAVNYKAKPDFNYPAGNYQVGIVYTATQP